MSSRISPAEVLTGLRFLCKLPAFLRHPVTVEEARCILRRRLERREADFLALLKRTVYQNPSSPYRPLLSMAGCEHGDVERLVAHEGVEGALRTLLSQGVYLTVNEFKGRRPVVRGSATISVDPKQLCNPDAAVHIFVRTSGSRGGGTPVGIDLAFVRETNVNHCLALDARGGARWLHAVWGVPGSAAMRKVLRFGGLGAPPVRWFSQVDPAAPSLHPRYRWSARVMHWGSLLAGVPLPAPVHVSLEDPVPIARWMAEVRRAGGIPHLMTFASSAVRLCQAARATGLDIQGAQLTMTGEPITAARLAEVRRAGVEAVPQYGNSEAASTIGYGCLAPDVTDELHLFQDLFAVIQPAGEGSTPELPPNAIVISSLRATAPLILLNVSLGDQAVVAQRACGCPLERLGWTSHLHTIRSYEKLSAGGMTFLDADLIRALEEVLPSRFGGGPTDYQLVEEETEEGHPRLRLLVHPAVGQIDPVAVAQAFLTAISPGSGVERVMGLLWRDAGFLQVERGAPEPTRGGKILHLRAARRPPSALPPSGPGAVSATGPGGTGTPARPAGTTHSREAIRRRGELP